ncbi:MAG: glycosyltransferase [Clostridia bacterium]|nr:glycosyltransferase [Clostridia bacterium]
MEKRMKVMIVATTPLCRDGLTAVLLKTARLTAQSHEVCFALGEPPRGEILAELREMGEAVILPSRSRRPFGYMIALSREIRRRRADCAVIHGNSATMALDLLAARRGGAVRRITHVHNAARPSFWKRQTLGRLLNRWVTVPVACSRLAGERLYTRPFRVIVNGVSCDRFRFDPSVRRRAREAWGLAEETFVLGHVGRFDPQKNHLRLIRIFAELVRRREDACLLLFGEGETEDACRRLAAELGLEGKVRFPGLTDEPEAAYAAMDAMAMPSLFEGLPLVGVEAQASGLPCVFSEEITGEVKILDESIFLPLTASDEAWAEAILTRNPGDRTQASDRVRAAGFDESEMKGQVRGLYE